jgi:DNA-binding NtrC family response regulator
MEARRFAQSAEPYAIAGEPCTGKRTLASVVHGASRAPLVAFSADAFPSSRIVAALFGDGDGHARRLAPAVERARGGTLVVRGFLELGSAVQARLLAAAADVRLVLVFDDAWEIVRTRLDEGARRVLRDRVVHVAPLRERQEDVRVLARRMWHDRTAEDVPEDVQRDLLASEWFGNASELDAYLADRIEERFAQGGQGGAVHSSTFRPRRTVSSRPPQSAIVSRSEETLEALESSAVRSSLPHLPVAGDSLGGSEEAPDARNSAAASGAAVGVMEGATAQVRDGAAPVDFIGTVIDSGDSYFEGRLRVIREFERRYAVRCLELARGNVTKAAAMAGIARRNFYGLLERSDAAPRKRSAGRRD